jgi:hypothetical protein
MMILIYRTIEGMALSILRRALRPQGGYSPLPVLRTITRRLDVYTRTDHRASNYTSGHKNLSDLAPMSLSSMTHGRRRPPRDHGLPFPVEMPHRKEASKPKAWPDPRRKVLEVSVVAVVLAIVSQHDLEVLPGSCTVGESMRRSNGQGLTMLNECQGC